MPWPAISVPQCKALKHPVPQTLLHPADLCQLPPIVDKVCLAWPYTKQLLTAPGHIVLQIVSHSHNALEDLRSFPKTFYNTFCLPFSKVYMKYLFFQTIKLVLFFLNMDSRYRICEYMHSLFVSLCKKIHRSGKLFV